MAKVKVATYNEIAEGGIKRYKVGGTDVAVYKISGKIFATSNLCTHESCYLDENGQIHNDIVECSCHGSQFEIKSGAVVTPPAVEALKTYRTEVIGEDIMVDV